MRSVAAAGERGLKRMFEAVAAGRIAVTPRAGAWIEIEQIATGGILR